MGCTLLNNRSSIYSYVSINMFLKSILLVGSWHTLGYLTVGIPTTHATGVQHQHLKAVMSTYFLTKWQLICHHEVKYDMPVC